MNFTINQILNLQEIINSDLINKLYNLFITHKSSHTISLSGNLYSATGYKSLIEALNTLYPNLIITVPVEGQYILFEDANVENVIKTLLNKSAGEGITIAGHKRQGFKELSWRKCDLDDFLNS